jgi:hypothetical protein
MRCGMSDEVAQALVSELAQMKAELRQVRHAIATAGKLAGLPQWIALVLLGCVLLVLLIVSLFTAGVF